jgi:hypothetical protein
MKKFKLRVFLISTIVVGVLSFVCFYAAFAETTDTHPSNLFESLSAKGIYVFGFPVITLISRFDFEPEFYTFFFLLVINCVLYGFLTERLFFLIKKKIKLIPVRGDK